MVVHSAWIAFAIYGLILGSPMLIKLWEWRQDLRSGYVHAVITDNQAINKTFVRKVQHDKRLGDYVEISKKYPGKYRVRADKLTRRGMLRVPYAYWSVGNWEPTNMQNMPDYNLPNPGEFDEALRSGIAAQVLASFKEEFVNTTSSMVVIIVVIILASFLVYRGIDGDVKQVITNQQIEDPALIPHKTNATPTVTPIGH